MALATDALQVATVRYWCSWCRYSVEPITAPVSAQDQEKIILVIVEYVSSRPCLGYEIQTWYTQAVRIRPAAATVPANVDTTASQSSTQDLNTTKTYIRSSFVSESMAPGRMWESEHYCCSNQSRSFDPRRPNTKGRNISRQAVIALLAQLTICGSCSLVWAAGTVSPQAVILPMCGLLRSGHMGGISFWFSVPHNKLFCLFMTSQVAPGWMFKNLFS